MRFYPYKQVCIYQKLFLLSQKKWISHFFSLTTVSSLFFRKSFSFFNFLLCAREISYLFCNSSKTYASSSIVKLLSSKVKSLCASSFKKLCEIYHESFFSVYHEANVCDINLLFGICFWIIPSGCHRFLLLMHVLGGSDLKWGAIHN